MPWPPTSSSSWPASARWSICSSRSICRGAVTKATAVRAGTMAEAWGRRPTQHHPRVALATGEFQRWSRTLDAERRAKVSGAIGRILAGGPTLGRPHVDVIHGSRIHKLKEARVDRGVRLLFAFDSNQNAVMLVGGDKTGTWNRWYPQKIALAERLYADHERSIGKEARCLSQREAGRRSSQRSR